MELALSLPVLCVVLLLVVQVTVVAAHRLAVQLAAREAGRAAAVSAAAGAPTTAAEGAVALRPLQVEVRERGGLVTVTVRYTDPTDVPIVGAMLPPVPLAASVTMSIEPPGDGL